MLCERLIAFIVTALPSKQGHGHKPFALMEFRGGLLHPHLDLPVCSLPTPQCHTPLDVSGLRKPGGVPKCVPKQRRSAKAVNQDSGEQIQAPDSPSSKSKANDAVGLREQISSEYGEVGGRWRAGGGSTIAARFIYRLASGFQPAITILKPANQPVPGSGNSAGPPGVQARHPRLWRHGFGTSEADMSLSSPWAQHRHSIRLGTLSHHRR